MRPLGVAAMLRAHAWIGIAASFGVLAVTTVANALQPNVDPFSQPVSNLVHGRGGWLVRATFALAGLACLALAAALRRAIHRAEGDAASALLGIGSACIALLAVFSADATVIPVTMTGRIHMVLAGAGFFLVTSSTLLYSTTLARDPFWTPVLRPLRFLARAALGVLCVTFVVLAATLAHGDWLAAAGLLERMLMGLLLAWTFLASWHLRRLASLRPRTDGDLAGSAD